MTFVEPSLTSCDSSVFYWIHVSQYFYAIYTFACPMFHPEKLKLNLIIIKKKKIQELTFQSICISPQIADAWYMQKLRNTINCHTTLNFFTCKRDVKKSSHHFSRDAGERLPSVNDTEKYFFAVLLHVEHISVGNNLNCFKRKKNKIHENLPRSISLHPLATPLPPKKKPTRCNLVKHPLYLNRPTHQKLVQKEVQVTSTHKL